MVEYPSTNVKNGGVTIKIMKHGGITIKNGLVLPSKIMKHGDHGGISIKKCEEWWCYNKKHETWCYHQKT